MKTCRPILVFLCLPWLPWTSRAEDTVRLKNGQSQPGQLISQSDQELVFEYKRTTGEVSRITLPWDRIEWIDFHESPELKQAFANPAKTALPAFAKLWDQLSPWLGRPRSRAAELGLNYAKRLAESKEDMAPEQALDLYKIIIARAWDPEKQAEAIRGRIATLLALNREREAVREAEALAEQTENPAHLLEAKYLLAANAYTRLQELEKENPRWQLDDEVRPQRNELFHRALDLSLFSYLFYGSEEAASARGLLQAAEVHRFAGDSPNARLCAEDILKLYPKTEQAEAARKMLNELPKPENNEK